MNNDTTKKDELYYIKPNIIKYSIELSTIRVSDLTRPFNRSF